MPSPISPNGHPGVASKQQSPESISGLAFVAYGFSDARHHRGFRPRR